MYKDIRYTLEQYRSGGSNRYDCPFCGQKKCFTRYIDLDTGEYLHETCGRCDHENSCPVKHYPPHQFFQDHPEYNDNKKPAQMKLNGKTCVLAHDIPSKRVNTAPVDYVQKEFFDLNWAKKASLRPSTFRTWFESLPFPTEIKQQVLAEYYVGATEKDVKVDNINYGPASVFWMIDEQQRVHDAKLIAYHSDGHRVQGWGNYMRAICEKTKVGPQLQNTEKVLFGAHLITKYPEKTVFIVESEKSALVCACHYPEHLWLATGGCSNLHVSKLKPLMNRHLVLVPDSGEYQKWNEKMQESGHTHYTVIKDLEQYESNTDIADIILGKAKKKMPEFSDADIAWNMMKEKYPPLNVLDPIVIGL